MGRIIGTVYGVVTYVFFLLTFCYAIGFVANLVVPKSIDSGSTCGIGTAVLINLGLLSLFAVQHNVMARPWFKKQWTTVVPKQVERTTFVLFTCAILTFVFWQWRPIGIVIWEVGSGAVGTLLVSMSLVGWAVVLLSTFMIDHFDLTGLRQVFLWNAYTRPVFKETSLYRRCRHPLYLGFIIAFWSTPRMTIGHLLFAAITTVWMVISIRFEENDLKRIHPEYVDYKARVPMLLPFGRKTSA